MILPIFIGNGGCPNRCLFCNERITADTGSDLSDGALTAYLNRHFPRGGKPSKSHEVAFYGGNFAGLPWEEERRLLRAVRPFIAAGWVHSIRLSTRPDTLTVDHLPLFREFQVQTVEIGAQSFDNAVLEQSRRGHTAEQVAAALHMLKESGFAVGLHLMAGLPGDDPSRFDASVEQAIALHPDMVRLHPTLVLPETDLARLFRTGRYRPLRLADAVSLCRKAVLHFARAKIPVIRLGLQMTPAMEKPGGIVAGPCHPAFRALVESSLYQDMAVHLLSHRTRTASLARFILPARDFSFFRGMAGVNLPFLRKAFTLDQIVLQADDSLTRGTLILEEQGGRPRISYETLEAIAHV